MTNKPLLFSSLNLRDLEIANRIVLSPMCQYSAIEGTLNAHHLVHLSQFAMGGTALIFVEATGVEERGRITHGCTGLWDDSQIESHSQIVKAVKEHGGAIGLQLAHAGRKASTQRPWEGDGPLTKNDFARGELAWEIIGPSAIPFAESWLTPRALSISEIADNIESWVAATKRAILAGYDAIEVHSAHGYLSHSFLSPLSNTRSDEYGGSLINRMRFTLELCEAVRSAWPSTKPLFVRISCVDGIEGGRDITESISLAKELKLIGVDVIDCSSGGICGNGKNTMARPTPGYQVEYAAEIRRAANIMTQAVGLVLDANQGETILRSGSADLVAIAREALHNPYWANHAAESLNADPEYESWPQQYGYWLKNRAHGLFAGRPGGSDTADQPNNKSKL